MYLYYGDVKKYAMEEIKIVQDILLKQEAYSHSAYKYSLTFIVGLVIAYLSDKLAISKFYVITIISISFVCFAYIQITYREAMYRGLERSRELQRIIGSRTGPFNVNYKMYFIYESFNEPNLSATWENFKKDMLNPRFLFPNLFLISLSISAVLIKA